MTMFDVPEWIQNPKEAPTDHYYEVELTPLQRVAFLDLLDNKKVPKKIIKEIGDAVAMARQMDGELPKERFNWKKMEAEAEKRGSTIADYLWDKRS